MDENQAVTEFLEAIRPAVARLMHNVRNNERERISNLIARDIGGAHIQRSLPSTKSRLSSLDMTGYGTLTKQVRDGLTRAFLKHPSGAGAIAIHAECPDLKLIQVRTALKTLTKAGDAIRVERGNYRPAQNPPQWGSRGVATPGSSTDSIGKNNGDAEDGPEAGGT